MNFPFQTNAFVNSDRGSNDLLQQIMQFQLLAQQTSQQQFPWESSLQNSKKPKKPNKPKKGLPAQAIPPPFMSPSPEVSEVDFSASSSSFSSSSSSSSFMNEGKGSNKPKAGKASEVEILASTSSYSSSSSSSSLSDEAGLLKCQLKWTQEAEEQLIDACYQHDPWELQQLGKDGGLGVKHGQVKATMESKILPAMALIQDNKKYTYNTCLAKLKQVMKQFKQKWAAYDESGRTSAELSGHDVMVQALCESRDTYEVTTNKRTHSPSSHANTQHTHNRRTWSMLKPPRTSRRDR